MSLASVLLRVMLSLSLAFGGAVPAMARMGGPAAARQSAASPATQAKAAVPMHCHEMASAAHPGRTGAPSMKHPAGSDGCCPSGKCDCACMHPAQLATRLDACPPGELLHAPVVSRLRKGHDEPVLAHLIRPPNAPVARGA